MTVVSTLITSHCTVHASDSLLTALQRDGTNKPKEWKKPKIVPVPRWRGAISYWGFAGSETQKWWTLDWLRERARKADSFSSAEEFAGSLADDLTTALSMMRLAKPTDAGIGIHFTAYECVDKSWIPELFLISNWVDPTYSSVHPDGLRVSRETYNTAIAQPTSPDHGRPKFRLRVKEFLEQGRFLIYNNGDPILFNPAANAILNMFGELARRRKLVRGDSISTYLAIARTPIQVVSKVQETFCPKGKRVVGGKTHDLSVTPGGKFFSTTGDSPR
jgi:hypothetical protein